MVDNLQLTIVEIISETDDVKTFAFACNKPVVYKPGQFLTFLFERKGSEIRRSYSLSSSPDTDDRLAITLKRVVNGEISGWWINEAKVGDILTALPPAGIFTIDWSTTPRDIFLIAAGSGITPLYSLLKSALIKEPHSRIHLVYSSSNQRSVIFHNQLVELEKRFPDNLKIEWRLSNHKNLLKARLSTYNLQDLFRHKLVYPKQNALVYTCGPYNFMMMVQITCFTMGFNRNNVRKEIFDILPPPENTPKYFDKKDRTITILYHHQSYTLTVPYNLTILDAALANDIALPYSCKAGRCSTCRCKIINGKIWMYYNEVLTDADEMAGFGLTCTGHPASEGVVISLED
jgi:ring-1,2-phenylacetyl-CoA epoxidase subunit PaaE